MILKGDCIEVMKAIKPNSVDAIVCDPPYGLEFMGKEWDKFVSTRPPYRDGKNYYKQQTDKRREGLKSQYDSFNHTYEYNAETLEHRNYFQKWCSQWLTEAYRVLKPGGSMLVMGGTRTSHRLACAIEDTGFIIKDTILWIFGSGFPKCQDITPMIDGKILGITTKQVKERREVIGKKIDVSSGKAMSSKQARAGSGKNIHEGWDRPWRKDESHCEQMTNITKPLTEEAKHWDGFKVGGIKPAYEPIIWAVKPPEGSYVDNVLKWGVGAVNVDECRVETNGDIINARFNAENHNLKSKGSGASFVWDKPPGKNNEFVAKGRFPANVILSHHPECVQVGMKRVKNQGGVPDKDTVKNSKPAFTSKEHTSTIHHFEKDGYEQVESWDCHPDCPIRLLDEQSGNLSQVGGPKKTTHKDGMFGIGQPGQVYYDGNAGASRFFYCAKASRGERNAGLEGMEEKEATTYHDESIEGAKGRGRNPRHNNPVKNNHPTVKPIKLFEWLIKLVTREGQIVLDPFIGSGTTAIGAHNTGRKCIGIEKEDEYIEIAKRRIAHWENQPKQMEMRI